MIRGALVSLALLCALPAQGKRVVAVLYFDNDSNNREYDVLQKGLADMLITDLSSVGDLQIVERENLQKLIDEQKLQHSRYFDPKTAVAIGKGTGAQYAVTGSINAIDPTMRIDVRLIEVATSKVTLATKVSGDRDRFLELETQLVQKFVEALHAGKASAELPSGQTDVASLLVYSKAVDAADRGDLEIAQKQLRQVMGSAPNFQLAKDRYVEILRRLKEAGQRRKSALGSDEELLLRSIKQAMGSPSAARRVGYRGLQATLHFARLKKLAAPGHVLPKSGLPEATALMREIAAEYEAMIAERSRAGAEAGCLIDPEGHQRARNLEVGDLICPERAAWESKARLAGFLLPGAYGGWRWREQPIPSLGQLDAEAAKKGFALLEQARAELGKSEPHDRESFMSRYADQKGESLLMLGKNEDAIAQWQAFLDAYPKATDYEKFEKNIEFALGIDANAKTFERDLASCSDHLVYAQPMMDAARRAYRNGPAALNALLTTLDKNCKGKPMVPGYRSMVYYWAAWEAMQRYDCQGYAAIADRAAQLAREMHSETMDDQVVGLGVACTR